MCGIAGICNPGPSAESILSRMINILHHRGPDQNGIYIDSRVAMGHARLTIVGLHDGTQPIGNEDETLWITYNGEIFNYPELRGDLLQKGHAFTTDTDTEVLLHLYEEYGPECVKLVNGQFAFAIWDSVKSQLFLARDRVGIRPLHYCISGNRFIFASEIKAIFMDPEVKREIDVEALDEIFTFWTTLTPKTAFRGVHEVKPGHYLLVKDGKIIEEKAFWTLPYYHEEERWQGSLPEAAEEMYGLLQDSIRLRLRADVPVGAYLSGGLDSSIITALISSKFNNSLKTFSIGFTDDAYDETEYQQEMVRHLGTDHTQTFTSNSDICDHFPQTIWHCEKPLLRTAPVPLMLLSRLVNGHGFKVVLTGEGADEVFGGYNIFKEAKIRGYWARNPQSRLRPLLLERLYPYIFKNPGRTRSFLQKFYAVQQEQVGDPFFSHRIRWSNSAKSRLFFSKSLLDALDGHHPEQRLTRSLPAGFQNRDILSRAQYLEMEIFLSNYLLSSQGDRMAMAHSLELRVPFLDYRVIDFAMKLPPAWKIKALNEKYILKRAFAHLLPKRILRRPKHPYRAPIKNVFFNGNPGYADDLLSDSSLKKTGYFDLRRVRYLVDKFRSPDSQVASETDNMALTAVISTQLLHHQYVETFAGVTVPPVAIQKIVRK